MSHSAEGSDIAAPSPPLSPSTTAGARPSPREPSEMADAVSASVLDSLVDEVAAELKFMDLPAAFQLQLQSKSSRGKEAKAEELIREVARAMQELVEGDRVEPVQRELLLDHLHSSGKDSSGPMCSLAIDRLNEEAEKVLRKAPAPNWAKFAQSGPTSKYEAPVTWDGVAEVVIRAFKTGPVSA